MTPVFTSKLPNAGTTIFTVMSALATQHKAINLGQGFPDYAMNDELIALTAQAMRDGHNQYAPMAGYLPLREAISAKVSQLYGASIHPQENITITPGGTYALFTAITTLIHPGDEVIVFEPAYDSYIPNIEVNGGIAIRIPLQHPTYAIDWQAVQAALSPRTKMIIINSPHNPTGAVLSEADIAQLSKLVAQTNLFIISDEVYEHLIFEGKIHQSLLRYPDLMERAVVCFSFGKVYDCTGWKVGYCIAPVAITKELQKVHQFNSFSVNTPIQVALAKYLQNAEIYLNLGKVLQQKRDYLRQLMQEATPFTPLPSYGSYFELYSFAGIYPQKETELATRLVKEAGVATIPTSAFYKNATDHKVLRFCFAKTEATLAQAVERLEQWCKNNG